MVVSNVFQHTLQPEGWSDTDCSLLQTPHLRFNTRSSRRAGATSLASVRMTFPAMFQHTLQPEGWSDGYPLS